MLYLMSENLALTVDIIKGVLLGSGIALFISLVFHLLLAWGLYSMARRRHVREAWLAWTPVGNLWMLGQLSDQYRRTKGQDMSARKGLLVFSVVVLVLLILAGIIAGTGVTELAERGAKVSLSREELAQLDKLSGDEKTQAILRLMLESVASRPKLVLFVRARMAVIGVVLSLAWVAALVLAVLCYRAMYYLFLSCDPQRTKLFLLLSILLNLGAVFVFALRRHDEGLPHDRKGRLLLN